MFKKNKQRAFALIEILFGVAIFLLIIGAVALFARNTWIYNSFISAGLGNSDAARLVLKTITSEIRTASGSDIGTPPINQATSSSLIFYSDIDNDGLKERVRYFITGTTLQKGVIKPTGSPLTYNVANEGISTLINNVTSPSVFSYYDRNYDGTTAALLFPVNIPSVRLIKINLVIDEDPNRSPAPMTFSTQVSIRNLKDNL